MWRSPIYVTQARTTVQEGRDLETCFIDPDHPAVKRVLNQLPVKHRAKGIPAMLAEVKTLVDMGFAEFRDKPPDRKVIPCRMVEKVKFYGNGDFDKVKIRCVVRGFLQKNGIDFGATYSPSCMLATLRILLTVAVTLGWDILQLDVKNAYVHGVMDREMWIQMPGGVHIRDPLYEADLAAGKPPRERALLLLRGLYGTHQGGKIWFERYTTELKSQGFTPCHYDPSLFQRWTSDGKCTYVAIYVDDSIITGSDSAGNIQIRDHILKTFGGTTGSLESFLGLHITYDKAAGRLEMRHTAYRQNIFDRFNISSELTSDSPYLHSNKGIVWDDERHTPMLNNYRAIVASWIFDMNACAPYAATPLLYLCMKMQQPTQSDVLALDAFMRFMAKHIDRPFVIQRPSHVVGRSVSTYLVSLTQATVMLTTLRSDRLSVKFITLAQRPIRGQPKRIRAPQIAPMPLRWQPRPRPCTSVPGGAIYSLRWASF